MSEQAQTKEHTIDAKDQSLGRVASVAATLLLGKNEVSFQKHLVADVHVRIVNASKLYFSQKKLKNKEYTRYTGYPGGLRKQTLEELINKHGVDEVVRKAVYGMLPNNKLRPEVMKHLTVEE